MQACQVLKIEYGGFAMKCAATGAGILLLALLFSTGALTMAQQSQTTTKQTPIPSTSAASGQEMFNAYCAACHGKDAKGDGPAVPALKAPPPDLTTLSQRHGGKFPADYVAAVLHNGVPEAKAHGSKDMPVWGPLFGSIGGSPGPGASQQASLRIYNVSRYIESLQVK